MAVKEKTKKQQIKNKWSLIKDKSDFLVKLADELDKSPLTLKNTWFSCLWNIPKKHIDYVFEYQKKYIKNQN